MGKNQCSAQDCRSLRHGRQDYCKVHYSRLRRTGLLERSKPGRPAMPEGERFWRNVDRTGDCWVWTARMNPGGYGLFWHHLAHRVAYRLTYGLEPSGLDHRCRNRSCVRPDHLRPATPAENSQNVGAHRDSKTGVRGVIWSKQRKKYRVRACLRGKSYDGGFFDSLADAEAAAIALRNTIMTFNESDRAVA